MVNINISRCYSAKNKNLIKNTMRHVLVFEQTKIVKLGGLTKARDGLGSANDQIFAHSHYFLLLPNRNYILFK